MSSGVPGQVGSVGPNSVRPAPEPLDPTDADLKVSATLPARVSLDSPVASGSSADLEVGMSSGVPGQVSSVGPNSVRPAPAPLDPTDADLKVSASLPARVSLDSPVASGSSPDLGVGMSSGVPGQVSSVWPNSVRPGPAPLGPTDADLKVSATLPARVNQVICCPNLNPRHSPKSTPSLFAAQAGSWVVPAPCLRGNSALT